MHSTIIFTESGIKFLTNLYSFLFNSFSFYLLIYTCMYKKNLSFGYFIFIKLVWSLNWLELNSIVEQWINIWLLYIKKFIIKFCIYIYHYNNIILYKIQIIYTFALFIYNYIYHTKLLFVFIHINYMQIIFNKFKKYYPSYFHRHDINLYQ